MDNTELHYLTYDPDEIWVEMMTNYVEAGGDILYPGDEKEMLLRSVQADLVQVFAAVDNALRMQTLRYAVGDYLDILGENRSCERIQAQAATAKVTITTNATGQTGTLPAGTSMTYDGITFYELDEDFALSGYEETVTVGVTADVEGSQGNGLVKGQELNLSVTNSGIKSIVCAEDASGGEEEEEDDAYRERIRLHGLASISTGPEKQYEDAAKAVSSEIVDAAALNIGSGKVGIYLIFASDTGKTAIISAVQTALSAVDVRPLTDSVSVYEAGTVPYTLDVHYAFDGNTTTKTAIAEAISEYQEWQDQKVGRPFNPDKLMADMYQAGATRVFWGANSSFNGGTTVTYTEIDADKHCKGTITLTTINS